MHLGAYQERAVAMLTLADASNTLATRPALQQAQVMKCQIWKVSEAVRKHKTDAQVQIYFY